MDGVFLKISRAPEPTNIIWKNVSVKGYKKILMKLLSIIFTFLSLVASFLCILAFQYLKRNTWNHSIYLSILMSILIAIINVV